MATLIDELGLVTHEDDIILPKPGGPPVEVLAVEDGFKCTLCYKAGRSTKTLLNHFALEHGEDDAPARYVPTKVQTFMKPRPLRYFAVSVPNPVHLQSSPYHVFIHDIAPKIPAPFSPLSMDKSDVDPLVQMTRWNIHLKPFLQSRSTIESLVSLTKIPDKNDSILSGLHAHVVQYMRDTRALADGAQFVILRMLHCYPL